MQTFLDQQLKEQVDFSLEIALVMKFIFNGERAQKSTRSFENRPEQLPKEIYLEVRSDQDLQVTSDDCKVIKSEKLMEIYNTKAQLYPQHEF